MSDPASPAPSPEPALEGMTGVRAGSPGRTPVRTRESGVTQSAWRLDVETDRGAGWIVRLDGAATLYRGEGVFLGWSQERLAAAWSALLPSLSESGFDSASEFPQLG
jgi:hypothetical protein